MKLNILKLSSVILIIFVLFNTYLIYKDHKKTNEIKNPVNEIYLPFKKKVLKRRAIILKKMYKKITEIQSLANDKNITIDNIFYEALNQPNKLISFFYYFGNLGHATYFALLLRFYDESNNKKKPICVFNDKINNHFIFYNNIILYNNDDSTDFKNFISLSATYSFIANLIQHIVKHPVKNQEHQNLIIDLSKIDFFDVFDYEELV